MNKFYQGKHRLTCLVNRSLEVEKLQDVNECDLDPDYCVQDVFTDNSPLLVILQKPFKTGRYSSSRMGKRKASGDHSQEMRRPMKSRRSSSIWMRNRENDSEAERERDGFVFTPLGSNSKEDRGRKDVSTRPRSPSIELSDNVGRPVSNYVIDDSANEGDGVRMNNLQKFHCHLHLQMSKFFQTLKSLLHPPRCL